MMISQPKFSSSPVQSAKLRSAKVYDTETYIVKQTLQDYENIKEKQLVTFEHDMIPKLKEVQHKVSEVSSSLLSTLQRKLVEISQFSPGQGQYAFSLSPHQMNTISAQLTYSTYIVKMVKYLSSMESSTGAPLAELNTSTRDIEENVRILIGFLTQDFLSNQQLSDIESEVYRLMSLIKLLDLWCKIKSHGKYMSLSIEEKLELRTKINTAQKSGWKLPKFKEEDHNETCDFVAKMSKKYSVNGLTDAERIEIVKAIGLTKGHWFKCPNGHYYCIGECGGAMQEAKCPECGATIGG